MIGYERSPWEQTPKWHPRYWFGHDIRRRAYTDMDGYYWLYQRSKHVAWALLRSNYDNSGGENQTKNRR
jgi:hypothetical protein